MDRGQGHDTRDTEVLELGEDRHDDLVDGCLSDGATVEEHIYQDKHDTNEHQASNQRIVLTELFGHLEAKAYGFFECCAVLDLHS